jgi:tartrate dehydratase beta subunit/fumarate hydratase class I family protein
MTGRVTQRQGPKGVVQQGKKSKGDRQADTLRNYLGAYIRKVGPAAVLGLDSLQYSIFAFLCGELGGDSVAKILVVFLVALNQPETHGRVPVTSFILNALDDTFNPSSPPSTLRTLHTTHVAGSR